MLVFKVIKKIFDPLWEIPIFYKLLQVVLAGGGHTTIKKYLIREIPQNAKKILDQGCGTGEYSLLFGEKYTGLDNNQKYIKSAKKKFPGNFIYGGATKMNIDSNSFDVCFAVGLHHHLSDTQAKKAITESLRVIKKNGKLVIVDAMLPKNRLNIFGFFLRKIDRGGNVRKVEETLNLLPKNAQYKSGILSSYPFDYVTVVVKK